MVWEMWGVPRNSYNLFLSRGLDLTSFYCWLSQQLTQSVVHKQMRPHDWLALPKHMLWYLANKEFLYIWWITNNIITFEIVNSFVCAHVGLESNAWQKSIMTRKG